MEIIIKDNGKGFEENEVDLGNGLNNLKKRAREIGAEITINSKLDKGTIITLTKPINT